MPELGIIEGYFGRSWTWAERAEVIDRLAPAGYRFIHYAPKIDARLRRDWQQPHSAEDAQSITAFSAHCRASGVRFGVGLTPYGAHLDFSADVRAALKAKLAQLNEFGLDDFAILFDDMRGDLPDLAERQAEIVAFVLDHAQASRFFMCPSYYSNDPVLDRVFGARPADYLHRLGQLMDPGIAVYWTGEEVCAAEISAGHLAAVADQLGRKVALWDNYPVNDGPRMSKHLHLRGVTGRHHSIAHHISHHAINPALQPVLGCIPALTLPMCYAQADGYCYGAAMAQAATRIVGPQLAHMLVADLLSFQNNGLDRLGERKATLREKYAALDHPGAREVVDWLDDGYAITGEMLETQ